MKMLDYSRIINPKNRKYLRDFIEIELKRRKTSERRRKDTYNRLRIILNETSPNKDIKTLTKQEADNITLKLVERYKKYWSIKSYIQILRQFIRFMFDLDDRDPLPKQFRNIKVPNVKSYTGVYRNEDSIVTPEEAFKLVEKNSRTKREAFAFMLLIDLGLRPHELLKGKKKDIRIDKLYHYHYKVREDTKTGSREPMIIFSIPYVQDYIKNLKDEDYLFPVSDQILWRTIKRITEGKCSPYDLRASSMSYYGMYLTDQELKARYGSEEYKHYVRLNREKLASKMDILTGRETNGEKEIEDLKKIAPKFCVSCNHYSKFDSSICSVCDKPLNPTELIQKKKMDEIAYKSTEALMDIDFKRFEEIANSLGARVEKD